MAEPIEMPFVVDLGGHKEPRIRWVSRSPCVNGQFCGERTCRPSCHPSRQQMHSSAADGVMAISPSGRVHSSPRGVTGAGEDDSTIHVRRRCGLLSKNHLFSRLHLSTMYVDAAYCEQFSVVYQSVCLLVYQSVSDSHEPCKNGWTEWDTIWDVDSHGPKEALFDRVHIGTTWRIRLNRPHAVAMRPYVKLLNDAMDLCAMW